MQGLIDVSFWRQGSWEQLCLVQLPFPLPQQAWRWCDVDSGIPKMEEDWIPESVLGGELPRELPNQDISALDFVWVENTT